ncbi:reverse transcriptase domain-containing protein [Tanacetum coccineum]
MRTRSQSREQHPPPPEEPPVVIEPLRIEYPFQEDPPVEPMADTRTMAQLLQAPTEGYEDAILIPEIVANNFELRHGLINLVQNKQFFDCPSIALRQERTKLPAPLPAPAPVKAVELSCVTCGGAHSHQNCPATHSNVYRDNISEYVSQAAAANYNQSWDKLSLPDQTPTCMKLELAIMPISKPMGIAKDISVKVSVFHFPADFVVVDFEPDPRVPLILGRCFLKTSRALIDVHKGELTLRIGSEAITYNLDQTSRYSANYTHMTANKIDVIDMACEEYSQKFLYLTDINPSVNFTPRSRLFPCRTDDPDCPAYNPFYYDPEGDILLLEAILNSEPPPPLQIKTIILERKKSALVKGAKVPQAALAWKLSDIQGNQPEFCTHKILMEEDAKGKIAPMGSLRPRICMEALQAQEDLMKSIENFLKKFNRISFGITPKVLLQAWDNFFEVKHAQSEEVQELLSKLVQDVKIISDELSEYINTPAWNRPLVYCDNDDDEDYTIAITPESPTKEPVNSLSLGDEHLDTIPATESDEFIKSSVENLVPTPIEFEDFSDDECDLPPYDDSSKNHDFTFSNPLFDIDEDFTLSDESFSEEDIPKENFIIFSNPLFDLDEEIASTKVDRINDEVLEGIHSIPPGIDSFDAESDLVESVLNRDISIDSSPKIDSLSNEFAGELILPKSIPPEIEEVEFDPEGDILFLESLLYDNSSPRPPEALQANSNAIESLPPSHIPVADNDSLMEEIDLFLADDGSIPPGIESDDVDSVDDDTSISLPEFESFYVDYPNSGNSTIDVVEDIPVDVPNVLPTHPILEQDFIPTSEFFAYVVWIFLPFLAYPVIPPSLLSCGDEDTIFDPGISKDCPDCEDSQFCHSSRVSHPQLHLGIRYPNLID